MAQSEAEREELALCEAVREAAKCLRCRGEIPTLKTHECTAESELCDAVRDAVKKKSWWKDVECRGHEVPGITGGWSPLPKGLDLAAGSEKPYRWALEAKPWEVGEQIWDAIKLASGLACGDFERGYLLCAACPGAFDDLAGHELFECSRVRTSALVKRNAKEWKCLLEGGKGRPINPPAAFTTRALISPRSTWAWYGHEVRLMRIDLPDRVQRRWFNDGWPNGVDREKALKDPHRKRSSITGVDGLNLNQRWTKKWWADHSEKITATQYEALYGLLLTRHWSDEEIRKRCPPPGPECGPWWWER